MNKQELINHVKKVAKNDLRIWVTPFVAVVQAAKKELSQPVPPTRASNNLRRNTSK